MKSPQNLWLRFILFLSFILLVNSWSLHHLRNNEIYFLIANAPLALVTIANFFSPLLRKQEIHDFRDKIRCWLFFFLKTPILILLYGLFFIASSFVSSVIVMSDGVQDNITIKLSTEGRTEHSQDTNNLGSFSPERDAQKKNDKTLNGPNDVEHFIRFTTPFSRPYFLEAKGYLRYSFDLFPWIGKTIRVSRDLIVSPSILIRVPVGKFAILSVGEVRVFHEKRLIAKVKTKAEQGSVLIGQHSTIPQSLIDIWRTELKPVEVENAGTAALDLLKWLHPLIEKPSISIEPGMKLKAEYWDIEGNVVAQADFDVGFEKIQDIIMSIKE